MAIPAGSFAFVACLAVVGVSAQTSGLGQGIVPTKVIVQPSGSLAISTVPAREIVDAPVDATGRFESLRGAVGPWSSSSLARHGLGAWLACLGGAPTAGSAAAMCARLGLGSDVATEMDVLAAVRRSAAPNGDLVRALLVAESMAERGLPTPTVAGLPKRSGTAGIWSELLERVGRLDEPTDERADVRAVTKSIWIAAQDAILAMAHEDVRSRGATVSPAQRTIAQSWYDSGDTLLAILIDSFGAWICDGVDVDFAKQPGRVSVRCDAIVDIARLHGFLQKSGVGAELAGSMLVFTLGRVDAVVRRVDASAEPGLRLHGPIAGIGGMGAFTRATLRVDDDGGLVATVECDDASAARAFASALLEYVADLERRCAGEAGAPGMRLWRSARAPEFDVHVRANVVTVGASRRSLAWLWAALG
jgi:hypothetical protein